MVARHSLTGAMKALCFCSFLSLNNNKFQSWFSMGKVSYPWNFAQRKNQSHIKEYKLQDHSRDPRVRGNFVISIRAVCEVTSITKRKKKIK